jgi:hypothetical protein
MRAFKLILCALVATALTPALASAKIVEVGGALPTAFPSCPSDCTVMTRASGYQARVGASRSVDTVPRNGSIVAWTLALGKPGPKQTAFFVNTIKLAATPQARLTILGRNGTKKLHYRVVAQGPLVNLTPYLGQTVQFPLPTSIPVKQGWIVAVTTPTWAPILSENLSGTMAWRNSRPATGCKPLVNPPPDVSLVTTGATGIFGCLFNKERLTYTATLVTTPGTPVIKTPTPPTPTTTTTTTTTPPTDTTGVTTPTTSTKTTTTPTTSTKTTTTTTKTTTTTPKKTRAAARGW